MTNKSCSERLKELKLFQIHGDNLNFVEAECLIMKHEKGVGADNRRIVFLDLSVKENWKRFLAEKDDISYYSKYDDEVWSKAIPKRLIAMAYLNSGQTMESLFSSILNNAIRLVGVSVSEAEGKRFIGSFLHWVIVFDLCDKLPVGGNKFSEPISLIEMGFMPRSVSGKWIVGYLSEALQSPKKEAEPLFDRIFKQNKKVIGMLSKQ